MAVTAETGLDETLAASRLCIALSIHGASADFIVGGYGGAGGSAAEKPELLVAAQLASDPAEVLLAGPEAPLIGAGGPASR